MLSKYQNLLVKKIPPKINYKKKIIEIKQTFKPSY